MDNLWIHTVYLKEIRVHRLSTELCLYVWAGINRNSLFDICKCFKLSSTTTWIRTLQCALFVVVELSFEQPESILVYSLYNISRMLNSKEKDNSDTVNIVSLRKMFGNIMHFTFISRKCVYVKSCNNSCLKLLIILDSCSLRFFFFQLGKYALRRTWN